MADATKDPLNVPLAATSDMNGGGLAAELNNRHAVPGDLRVEPDPTLQGYQEDLDSGGNNDVIENENNGTTPSEATTMPVKELKQELDKLAIDEHDASPADASDEDRRESIEDLDEGDKRD